MRWFRRGGGDEPADPGQVRALVDDVRGRYGGHLPQPFREQSNACFAQLRAAPDGLAAAIAIVGEFADDACADVYAQAAQLGRAADRRNYRPLWRDASRELRWNLFQLPRRLHPYIQVSAAVALIGAEAKRVVRETATRPLLAQLFEILDLTVVGWEFARVRPDTDTAELAVRLIGAARDLRAAMSDEPPLPDPVRELMRTNRTIEIYDPQGPHVVAGLNPGQQMREALLA
ncbi:hypothetical protein KOI35_20855 [Actinoplanes bogorensis]|uniref:Uncharacterized protein n=1 Tax=Paractinoplanes bogorensis TaxID=1610840 RepID=A0ABS5YR89_9ACTN|nr:hypothetical protein [Actinoplanes bogorensis]MBU2665966.1 hypothetical protein [Actinoplanes bogorensis]